jgi:acetyltransferase-like isoleucine patch superfamily enzyme
MPTINQGIRALLNALRHRNVSYRSIVLGDIEISPSAAIGPNCVLKADDGSRILIEPGVDIKRDCRLFARNGGDILLRSGATIKSGTRIMPREKGFAGSVEIGEDTVIHRENSLDNTGDITIGPNVRTGENTYFHTHVHPIENIETIWEHEPHVGGICVGEGCWIGTMCQLMPGSGMPAHSVLAAGGIATEAYDSRGLFGGVPAERIQDL